MNQPLKDEHLARIEQLTARPGKTPKPLLYGAPGPWIDMWARAWLKWHKENPSDRQRDSNGRTHPEAEELHHAQAAECAQAGSAG